MLFELHNLVTNNNAVRVATRDVGHRCCMHRHRLARRRYNAWWQRNARAGPVHHFCDVGHRCRGDGVAALAMLRHFCAVSAMSAVRLFWFLVFAS
jgi:hypothetical protein